VSWGGKTNVPRETMMVLARILHKTGVKRRGSGINGRELGSLRGGITAIFSPFYYFYAFSMLFTAVFRPCSARFKLYGVVFGTLR
jgi:hypothetical protein